MKFINQIVFCTVLFSCLILSAQAQITKTLNGTVSHESGMAKSTLTTNKGNVVVTLPGLQGKLITGTVSAEPAGKTEKEKKRNLEDLMKMVVVLKGQKIPVSELPKTFDWSVPENDPSRTPLELLNESGEMLASVSLPAVLPAAAIINSGPRARLSTPSAMLVKGDVLNVYTDQDFSPGATFVLTDSKGQQFTLKPIASSSQQAILKVPEEAAPGNYVVNEEPADPTSTKNNTEAAKFKLIDFSLSSPNTNLRNGQTSTVTVAVQTQQTPESELDDLQVITVDIKNLTPQVVSMAGGNMQVVSFPLNNDRDNPSGWQLTRSITGVKPGGFSVSATLHEDNNSSNEPFRPQLNALETPEEYAAWVTALKKDLREYAAIQNNEETGQAIKSNIQRAIDNLPISTSPELLDESKAVAYTLLRSVNVPKGAANTWLSGYEAFKSALSGLGGTEPVSSDLPSYSNGLDFMERLSYKSNDPSMIGEITKARELISTITSSGETKENLNELSQYLHSLSSKTDKKLMTNPTGNKIWNLSDLLFSTYCMNKRTKDGIDPLKSMIAYLDPDKKILMVKPEYQQQVLSSLKAVSLGNNSYKISAVSASLHPVVYNIQVTPLLMTTLFSFDSWAQKFIDDYKSSQDMSGAKIINTQRDSTGTWYIFYKDARCTQKARDMPHESDQCYPDEKKGKDGIRRPTGFYWSWSQEERAKCRNGNDFCTEVSVISETIYYYLDAECTRLVRTKIKYDFSCL